MADSTLHSTELAVEPDLSGRQLGDYRLLRRLGRGAMAEVYLAEQAALRRQVALKVLKHQLAADESYVRRFHQEAQAAASLVHANIVQIHDVGCIEGVHYISQEYVQGQNLREWLVRRGPPELKLAVSIMRQVAAALQKAAERGIVHRDIKPENIMISREGEVKVADFGLARLSSNGSTASVTLTQVGVTMGTPLYMSPEQVEGRGLDPRSDIYSFGVTCYHMLAGVPPFRGETPLSVAVQHLKSQPERLENLRPDLPVGLSRIVHKMLAKDPSHRHQRPRELLSDLRALQLADGNTEWPADLAIDDAELASLSACHDATQRLDSLMKTQSLLRRNRRWLFWLAGGLFAAFVLGMSLALLAREPNLLAGTGAPHMAKYGTPEEQLFFAKYDGGEDALQSVAQFYPEATYQVRQAKQELALLYLVQNREDEAARLFDMFANLDDTEPESRAFGLVGQAFLEAHKGRHEQSAKTAAEATQILKSIRRERLHPQVLRLLEETAAANDRALKQRTKENVQRLIDQYKLDQPEGA